MIVIDEPDSLLLITQPDHAHFSGELLSLWRDDGLPTNPRREEIVFAARHHDNGWREADAVPRVDPRRGRPYSFLDLPAPARAEIWLRGVARYREDHPYAALLIHEHAIGLHASVAGEEPYGELLEELRRSQGDLLEATETPREWLQADYPLVGLSDLLSLVGCGCFSGRREKLGRSFSRRGDRLEIRPLPLAGSTRFRIPCRRIAKRSYGGDADLAGHLAAARFEALEVRVA